MVLLLGQEGAEPLQQKGHLGKTSGVVALDIFRWTERATTIKDIEGASNERMIGKRTLPLYSYSAEVALLLLSVRLCGI